MAEQVFELAGKRVWIAGHRGMVGSALVRRLLREPIGDLVTAASDEVDLRDQSAAEEFVKRERPAVAIVAAARVGGIHINRMRQADFLYENLMISSNCIMASHRAGVEKTVYLGSSCIYPRDAVQPIREEYLMTGPLEPTNEGYAIAKIAGVALGRMVRRQYGTDIISLLPSNLYGPGDNYDLESAHVLAALLRKVHEAKVRGEGSVVVWGSGTPRREFLFVDDLADGVVHALKYYSDEDHLNIGTGTDVSIIELVRVIGEVIGWHGTPKFDTSMPDGMKRKCLDVSRIRGLGWSAVTDLEEGIRLAYEHYLTTDIGAGA